MYQQKRAQMDPPPIPLLTETSAASANNRSLFLIETTNGVFRLDSLLVEIF